LKLLKILLSILKLFKKQNKFIIKKYMETIKVKLKDNSQFEGILLLHPKYIIIKLKNGYNVALDKEEIEYIEEDSIKQYE